MRCGSARARQRHRAADQLADEVKARQSGGIGDGEQVLDHLLERPFEVRRRDMRAPVATHVEADQPMGIGQRRKPSYQIAALAPIP